MRRRYRPSSMLFLVGGKMAAAGSGTRGSLGSGGSWTGSGCAIAVVSRGYLESSTLVLARASRLSIWSCLLASMRHTWRVKLSNSSAIVLIYFNPSHHGTISFETVWMWVTRSFIVISLWNVNYLWNSRYDGYEHHLRQLWSRDS
jgi:hypothetical protein